MKFISTFLALFMATVAANAQKYIGGDISALTRNETFNPTFLDKNGKTVSDPLDIFKSEEMNIM